jgi:hypothetical protein
MARTQEQDTWAQQVMEFPSDQLTEPSADEALVQLFLAFPEENLISEQEMPRTEPKDPDAQAHLAPSILLVQDEEFSSCGCQCSDCLGDVYHCHGPECQKVKPRPKYSRSSRR